MKKHDKNLPPEGHQPPPENPHKHERRRRRGGIGVIVVLVLLVLLIAAGYILWQNGFFSFGKGNGEGSGNAAASNGAATSEEISAELEESTIAEIIIENDKIFFDGVQLASAEELKNKITEIGDKKTYNLIHDTAIKATYDEVTAVLTELERALSIKVNYNDER